MLVTVLKLLRLSTGRQRAVGAGHPGAETQTVLQETGHVGIFSCDRNS